MALWTSGTKHSVIQGQSSWCWWWRKCLGYFPVFSMMTKPGRPTIYSLQRINSRIPGLWKWWQVKFRKRSRDLSASQTNFTHSSICELAFFFCSPCPCGFRFFSFFKIPFSGVLGGRCMYSTHFNTKSTEPLTFYVEMYRKHCDLFYYCCLNIIAHRHQPKAQISSSQFSFSFGPFASYGVNKGELWTHF